MEKRILIYINYRLDNGVLVVWSSTTLSGTCWSFPTPNLVWPSPHWSSKASVSLPIILPNLL